MKSGKMKIGIIGAGHNGLVCGAYLAKAGFDVTIFERRDKVGGMCVTEELIPGYKISSAACWFGMLRKKIIDDLKLFDLGLDVYPADPQTFAPFPDGSYFLSSLDPRETIECVKRLSPRDAKNWPIFWEDVFRAVNVIKPYLLKSPVPQKEINKRLAFLNVSPFETSILSFLSRYFSSEKVILPLATLSLAVRYGTPSSPGTLFNFLYMLTAETDGIPGAWGFARGGMGSVAQALKRAAEANRVKILLGSCVKKILVDKNKAIGIVLRDNTKRYYFDLIVSNLDPTTTFTSLLQESLLPSNFVAKIKNLDTSGSSVALHMALSHLPSFKKWKNVDKRLNGIVIIAPSLEYIEKSYSDYQKGVITDSPIITFSIPSINDPSVAPQGKHLLSMYVQYVSNKIDWTKEKNKKSLFSKIMQILKQYSPDFEKVVKDWVLLSPKDFENTFGVYAGNHEHIQMEPNQLFDKRPVSGYSEYSCPIDNLYLCGAGTHPGGTVIGACGFNCANTIIKKFS